MSTICKHGNYVGDDEACGRCFREMVRDLDFTGTKWAVEQQRSSLISKIEAGRLVARIIEDLASRSALGLAWEQFDDSRRNEIRNTWTKILLDGP